MTMEKAAVHVPLRISAAIDRLGGSLDLGKDVQFLCHVERSDYRHEETGTVAEQQGASHATAGGYLSWACWVYRRQKQ